MKKLISLLDNRYGLAVFYLLISFFLTALLGCIFSAIIGDFPADFYNTAIFMFFFFFAGVVFAAVLLVITKIPTDLAFGFGCGLYYGMIAVATAIGKLWTVPSEAAYSLGFIITALICYIVWLKKFKPDS